MKNMYQFVVCALLIFAGLMFTACEREVVERTAVQEQDDEKITALVKEALGQSPTYKFPDVQVATYKGRVQLSGFVLTGDQKASAAELARGTPGVVEVENNISIKQ